MFVSSMEYSQYTTIFIQCYTVWYMHPNFMRNPAISVRIRIPAFHTISVHFILHAMHMINTDKYNGE